MSSNTSTQDSSYIHSLKQIKELEEKVQVEIDSHKKQVDLELKKLDEELANAIEAAKADGERVVDESIKNAQKKASAEASKIIEDANKKAKSISGHMDIPPTLANKLIDILLAGL